MINKSNHILYLKEKYYFFEAIFKLTTGLLRPP
jgi:hypothetical protein